jgi:rare lipoprotein A
MKRIITLLLIFTCFAIFAAQAAETELFRQEGVASWYGKEFAGRPTASGEIFNPDLFTAAHPTLPFGTVLTVTNKQNMRQVIVKVNDRGPFVATRIIDLSRAAAETLDMINTGIAHVIIEQAQNINFGPVAGSNIVIAGEPNQPKKETTYPLPALEIVNVLPDAPLVEDFTTTYPGPAARILGGVPPAGSVKFYRLQVGAYKMPRNAVNALQKLQNAGFNPACEQQGEFYRVILYGLRAEEIPSIAQRLGDSGFREVIIREE